MPVDVRGWGSGMSWVKEYCRRSSTLSFGVGGQRGRGDYRRFSVAELGLTLGTGLGVVERGEYMQLNDLLPCPNWPVDSKVVIFFNM